MTNLDYLYNPDAAEVLKQNYFVRKNLGFRIIERGTVVPYVPIAKDGRRVWEFGGVVNGKGRFVESSVGRFGEDDIFTPRGDVPYVPATVVYLGLFYPIWGHFITEGLRYFWASTNGAFRKFFRDCPPVYIPCELKYFLERQQNFRRLVEILGVDVSRLQPITQPMQFENIILPDESFFLDGDGQRKFTDTYCETIDRVRDFALKNRTSAAKKIYYFYGRAQLGEERVADYFRSKGYEIVLPEKLTLDEQLNVLINAESFASTIGSCSHNSVFLRDGTEVILIPRGANRLTPYQLTLNQVHELNINYVDSSLSIFSGENGPYCFIVSEQLKKFFGDKFDGYGDDDLKTFLTYSKLCVEKGFRIAPDAGKYYGKTLTKFHGRSFISEQFGLSL